MVQGDIEDVINWKAAELSKQGALMRFELQQHNNTTTQQHMVGSMEDEPIQNLVLLRYEYTTFAIAS